jgi:protein O-mannosyl-transferase
VLRRIGGIHGEHGGWTARPRITIPRPMANSAPAPGPSPEPAPNAARTHLSALLPVLLGALLVAATLAAFWPCVHGGFVALDDDANFELNHRFRGLGSEQLRWMWSEYHYGHWHPLTWATFGLDFALHGLDAPAYHVTNLVVHVLSVLAVFALAAELLRWIAGWVRADAEPEPVDRSRAFALQACAFLAAATWGLHPLRVESVAWLTERRDLLSALFLALATWAYLRSARFGANQALWLLSALALYALSLLSKAWGITFPVVLLVLDVFPVRRFRAPHRSWLLAQKVPFALMAGYTMFRAAAAQRDISAAVSLGEHGIADRIAQACYGLVFYVVKTLWPSDLACHYLLDLNFSATRPIHLAAIAAVLVVTAALAVLARRVPAGLATWAFYGILVSPVLGFFQSGSQKVADRYSHLSAIPFSILLAGAVLVAVSRRGEERQRHRGALATLSLALGLALVLGFASNRQTRVWNDSETLFRHAAEVEPDNYFVLHNLCVALYRRQAYAEALEIESRSVAAHPGKGNEEARYTVGLLHAQLGDPAAAEKAWEETLAVVPDHLRTLEELERRKVGRGDVEGAIAMYERSVAANSGFEAGYKKLDALYRRQSQLAKALETWKRAASTRRVATSVVENGMGRAQLDLGRFQEAEQHLMTAQRIDNTNLDYVVDVCDLFYRTGRLVDAEDNLRRVLELNAGHARAQALMRTVQAARARG